jgi:hypothetical protein
MIAVASKDPEQKYPEEWGIVIAPSSTEAFRNAAVELHGRIVQAKTVPPNR